MLKLDLVSPLADFELRVSAELGPTAAVLGPSGAGKTCLLEVIAGLRPANGRIELDGRVLFDSQRGVRLAPEERELGYVPQDGALFPHLSVRENLRFGRRRGRPATAAADLDDVVDLLELEAILYRTPRRLSGGERRRVALGRALLSTPRLLLLDEPTAGLDPERAAKALGGILKVHERRRVPLLVVTHREGEALALADWVLRLSEGRSVASGSARELLVDREILVALGGRRVPNVAAGHVARHDPAGGVTVVTLGGGVEVTIPPRPGMKPGAPLTLGVEAGALLVATEAPRGLSARNVVEGRLDELIEAGDSVFARVGSWLAHLTPAAVSSLELRAGQPVWLVVKTHSWRVLAG